MILIFLSGAQKVRQLGNKQMVIDLSDSPPRARRRPVNPRVRDYCAYFDYNSRPGLKVGDFIGLIHTNNRHMYRKTGSGNGCRFRL